jgi:hypothetical protein
MRTQNLHLQENGMFPNLREYLSIWQKMQAISEDAGSAIHICTIILRNAFTFYMFKYKKSVATNSHHI